MYFLFFFYIITQAELSTERYQTQTCPGALPKPNCWTQYYSMVEKNLAVEAHDDSCTAPTPRHAGTPTGQPKKLRGDSKTTRIIKAPSCRLQAAVRCPPCRCRAPRRGPRPLRPPRTGSRAAVASRYSRFQARARTEENAGRPAPGNRRVGSGDRSGGHGVAMANRAWRWRAVRWAFSRARLGHHHRLPCPRREAWKERGNGAVGCCGLWRGVVHR